MATENWPSSRPELSVEQCGELQDALSAFTDIAAFEISSQNGRPRIEGRTARWDDVVAIGHALSDAWFKVSGQREVVVDLTSNDTPEEAPRARTGAPVAPPSTADIVVIGGGIIGMVVSQKLAALGNNVVTLESRLTLGTGATRCNNGMVHSGFDPKPGTLKGKLNVEGNRLWDKLASDLGIRLRRTGSAVVSLTDDQDGRVEEYFERGKAKGVPVEIVSGEEIRNIEPRLSPDIRRALMTPTTGYVEAEEVCHASAKVLRARGSEVFMGVGVERVVLENGRVTAVETTAGTIETELVINAAGIFADHIAETAGARDFSLHARRGTLVIVRDDPAHPYEIGAGPVPSPYTKGGGVTPRPYGTLSLGPSAFEQASRTTATPTAEEIDWIVEQAKQIYPDIDVTPVVEVEARLRASSYGEDFIIGPAPGVPGFYHVSGIQSPGVAAAPAIANKVVTDLLALGFISTATSRYQEIWR
ncbi:FAD-dependent oxidoreductase [Actinomycetaceae bacterium L2_0104]